MNRWMKRWSRWQDWCVLALAVWVFISPWALRYAYGTNYQGNTNQVASGTYQTAGVDAWNDWVCGVVLFFVVLWAVSFPWAEWASMGIGIWLIISPWVLGYTDVGRVAWNNWIIGALIFLLAFWAWWIVPLFMFASLASS